MLKYFQCYIKIALHQNNSEPTPMTTIMYALLSIISHINCPLLSIQINMIGYVGFNMNYCSFISISNGCKNEKIYAFENNVKFYGSFTYVVLVF